jgi:hypothetical protein
MEKHAQSNCVKEQTDGGTAKTFVARLATSRCLPQHAVADILTDLNRAVAIVALKDEPGVMYYIVTLGSTNNGKRALELQLSKVTDRPKVDWVKQLDRRLQRMLGWGDVNTTHADVERACGEQNIEELLQILPAAEVLIRHREFDRLATETPDTGLLALDDCLHEFVPAQMCRGYLTKEARELPVICGAISKQPVICDGISKQHGEDMLRCWKCLSVRCTVCERNADDPVDVLRARHDKHGTHVFGAPDASAECTFCDRKPAAVCSCGAQRCEHCQTANRRAQTTHYALHPTTPDRFYVKVGGNMSNLDKVAWIRSCEASGDQEISGHTQLTLPEFVVLYCKFFGGFDIRSKKASMTQKTTCLMLFGLYDPTFKAQLIRDLAPWDLSEFERLWDPLATPHCHACSSVISDPTALEKYRTYCSELCYTTDNPPARIPMCEDCGGLICYIPGGRVDSYSLDLRVFCRVMAQGAPSGQWCRGCGKVTEIELVRPGVWRTVPVPPVLPIELIRGKGHSLAEMTVALAEQHKAAQVHRDTHKDPVWKLRRRNF